MRYGIPETINSFTSEEDVMKALKKILIVLGFLIKIETIEVMNHLIKKTENKHNNDLKLHVNNEQLKIRKIH